MEICSIGFTKWSAAGFFGALSEARVERLVDVRVSNTSQLAGFAKRSDLGFFLDRLVGVSYEHHPDLAPTPELLKAYRSKEISWPEYEPAFLDLLDARAVAAHLDPDSFRARSVLLCSEHEPDRCHRRLVIDYLADHWGGISARHL